jgi:hypothetical protein
MYLAEGVYFTLPKKCRFYKPIYAGGLKNTPKNTPPPSLWLEFDSYHGILTLNPAAVKWEDTMTRHRQIHFPTCRASPETFCSHSATIHFNYRADTAFAGPVRSHRLSLRSHGLRTDWVGRIPRSPKSQPCIAETNRNRNWYVGRRNVHTKSRQRALQQLIAIGQRI